MFGWPACRRRRLLQEGLDTRRQQGEMGRLGQHAHGTCQLHLLLESSCAYSWSLSFPEFAMRRCRCVRMHPLVARAAAQEETQVQPHINISLPVRLFHFGHEALSPAM